jgi:ATP-dependent Clp protease ATP-binding subunit ClpA
MRRTPRFEQILARAEEIAGDLRHQHVGVEHLQLAILDDGDSIPAKHFSEFMDIGTISKSLYSYLDSDWYKNPVTKYRSAPK